MEKVLFATGNAGKVREMRPLFNSRGFKLEQVEVDIDEIDALEVEEVAKRKARDSFHEASTSDLLIVEDTGFYVDALGGFPGAKAAFFSRTAGVEKLLNLMDGEENREARFRTAIAAFDGDRLEIFTGEVEGRVTEKKRGESDPSLPYNSFFIPENEDRTFAEDKQLIEKHSHRQEVTEKFLKWLENERE